MAPNRGTVAILPVAAALVMGATSCAGQGGSQPTPEPSVAEQLSVVDGQAAASDFQEMVDCLTSSGAPGTETEVQVGDTLVAAWEQSSKKDSLYAFSRAAASVYGC
jgi:hypothetical protein